MSGAGARTLVAALTAGVVSQAELAAQTCSGFPSHQTHAYRVSVHAASYSYANAISATVSGGRRGYWVAALARTHDAELQASSYEARAEVGADVQSPFERVQLCPVGAVAFAFGPSDFVLRGVDYRYRELALGFGVAAAGGQVAGIRVELIISARLVHLSVTATPDSVRRAGGVPTRSSSDVFALTAGTISFTFRDFTLQVGGSVPSGLVSPASSNRFVVPFGREDREVSLNAGVGVALGRRTRVR